MASAFPSAAPSPPRRSTAPRAGGPSAATATCAGGTNSRRAAISRLLSSPLRSSTKSVRSSARCGDRRANSPITKDPLMTDFDQIDFFTDKSIIDDPYPYFDYLRSQCPVLHDPRSGVVAVTGYDELSATYRDTETFSSIN